jgi:hypothetical protein
MVVVAWHAGSSAVLSGEVTIFATGHCQVLDFTFTYSESDKMINIYDICQL